jgi:Tfp pilus assembly protein PilN
MKTPDFLTGRLNILTAAQQADGWCCTLYVAARRRGRVRIVRRTGGFVPAAVSKKQARHPWTLIVHGPGIVSRPWDERDASVRRIAEHPAEFLSAVEAGNLVFMRRELYDSLVGSLGAAAGAVIATRMSAAGPIADEVRAAAEDHFERTLAPKNLLRPGAESSLVLSLAARRLTLPVLAAILLMAAGNFGLQRRGQRIQQQQRAELEALEHAAARRNDRRQDRQSLESLLLPSPALPYAWMADRVAAGVPGGITLTRLEIHPLSQTLRHGQLPAVSADRLIVGGRSALTEPVTEFADTLRGLPFTRSLTLLSMGKERSGDYAFEIEIGL